MKRHNLLLLCLGLLVLASCSDNGIFGEGPIISETREVNSFHSIRSEIGADIYLTQESPQSLRIEANENLLAIIDTRVVNGQLIIDTDRSFRSTSRIQVHISAEDFRRITLTGSGSLESMNCMELTELDLTITGSADVQFCGSVNELSTTITGSGNIDAYGLEANEVEATITGSGDIKITALESLDVRISGSGSVRYKGNPVVTSDISGSGRIRDAN